MQKSKYLTISSFIGRFLYLVLILVFIKAETDYIIIPVFNSIGYLTTGILSFIYIFRKYKISYETISFYEFKEQLQIGKFMFLSEIKLYFMSYFNVLLLGLLSGNIAVAYFVGAEKIIRAICNIFTPIQNSLFPILAIQLNNNKQETIKILKKTLPIAIGILFVFSVFLFLFSEDIIILILGDKMKNSIIVFKILSIVPLLTFLDLFFGKQILLNLKKEKQFFKVILFIAIINIPIIFYFIRNYSYIGASVSQLTTQFLLVTGLYYYSYKALKAN